MLRSGGFITLDMTSYSLFAMLAGLTLLVGTNHASPGCTGPAVERCDYVEAAKAANSGPDSRPFRTHLGFNVFDQGSSVLVQQSFPSAAFVHAPAVWIDKKSCRPCEVIVYGHISPPFDDLDYQRGRLIQSIPPEDAKEAELLRSEYEKLGYPFELDVGTPAERY